MFNALKRLFNFNSNSPPHSNTDQHPRTNHFLTTQEEILAQLLNIKTSNPTCTIFFEYSKESYNSELLEINALENTMHFDRLKPESGNTHVHRQKNLKAIFFLHGDEFSCQLTRARHTNPSNHYQFLLPRKIYVQPSKSLAFNQHFVDVHSLKIPFDGFSTSNRLPVSGYVNDLSINSISAYVTTNKTNLERGDLLKECHITLPETKQVITFDLTINIVKKPTTTNIKTFVSGVIQSMPNIDKAKYDHFITSIERHDLKKRNF